MGNFLDPENVSLKNLAGGGAIERFDVELEKVLENILDPNMDPKKKRTITLKVTVQSDQDRNFANTEISCDSTLAPLSSFSTGLYIGRDVDGTPFAKQNNLKQKTFADLQNDQEEPQPTTDGNVTSINERKQG